MIGLVTSVMAEPLDRDLPELVAAFDRAGGAAAVVAWDDPAVEWGSFDLLLLRSTWDYVERPVEFDRWLSTASRLAACWNRPEAVAWNRDKRYLHELAAAGVAVVSTRYVEPGHPAPAQGLDPGVRYVVKPTLGAGSRGAARAEHDAVADHVRALHEEGLTAMIQPYQHLIDELGETALVYLGDGRTLEFSHAFSKGSILGSSVEVEGGFIAVETIGEHEATPEERALGAAVLGSAPVRELGPLAYARVDLVPTAGGPALLELELIEPSLYFHTGTGSADRAVAGWRRLPTTRRLEPPPTRIG